MHQHLTRTTSPKLSALYFFLSSIPRAGLALFKPPSALSCQAPMGVRILGRGRETPDVLLLCALSLDPPLEVQEQFGFEASLLVGHGGGGEVTVRIYRGLRQ